MGEELREGIMERYARAAQSVQGRNGVVLRRFLVLRIGGRARLRLRGGRRGLDRRRILPRGDRRVARSRGRGVSSHTYDAETVGGSTGRCGGAAGTGAFNEVLLDSAFIRERKPSEGAS